MNTAKCTAIIGFIFVSILGTLNHFVYDWTGNNAFIGLFTATNESTWEHMKLLFFPMLFYAILVLLFAHRAGVKNTMNQHGQTDNTHACSTFLNFCAGILIGTFSIPVLFYAYKGILGFGVTFIDILIFFVSTFLAFFTYYNLQQSGKRSESAWICILLVIILAVLFPIFTIYPPKLGIFVDPTL